VAAERPDAVSRTASQRSIGAASSGSNLPASPARVVPNKTAAASGAAEPSQDNAEREPSAGARVVAPALSLALGAAKGAAAAAAAAADDDEPPPTSRRNAVDDDDDIGEPPLTARRSTADAGAAEPVVAVADSKSSRSSSLPSSDVDSDDVDDDDDLHAALPGLGSERAAPAVAAAVAVASDMRAESRDSLGLALGAPVVAVTPAAAPASTEPRAGAETRLGAIDDDRLSAPLLATPTPAPAPTAAATATGGSAVTPAPSLSPIGPPLSAVSTTARGAAATPTEGVTPRPRSVSGSRTGLRADSPSSRRSASPFVSPRRPQPSQRLGEGAWFHPGSALTAAQLVGLPDPKNMLVVDMGAQNVRAGWASEPRYGGVRACVRATARVVCVSFCARAYRLACVCARARDSGPARPCRR
jgi:hypothetical protein